MSTIDNATSNRYGTGDDEAAQPTTHRWRPVLATLGSVVALGAIATAIILNSGDSASTTATIGAPTPRTMTSRPFPTAQLPAPTSTTQPLPPETGTTMAPPDPGSAGKLTAAPDPRKIVYRVTGTKQLLDLVNVVYTDERGVPVTEFNVSLPWTRVVVLNPGVQTESVVGTSLYGRLNCAIVNAAGQPVVTSTSNTFIATCTR